MGKETGKNPIHDSVFYHSKLFHPVFISKDLIPQLRDSETKNSKSKQFKKDLFKLLTASSFETIKGSCQKETQTSLVLPILKMLGWNKDNGFDLIQRKVFNVFDTLGDSKVIIPPILVSTSDLNSEIDFSEPLNGINFLQNHVTLPVVSDYFGEWGDTKAGLVDRKRRNQDLEKDSYISYGPDARIEKYLSIVQSDWGVATDGYRWRIYKRSELNLKSDHYFEFELGLLANFAKTISKENQQAWMILSLVADLFYAIFSHESHKIGPVPAINRMFAQSRQYSDTLEEDLKERFVHTITIACNGYLGDCSKKEFENRKKVVAKTSESLIFSLIFIRACESSRILKLHESYLGKSLSIIIDKIRHYNPEVGFESSFGIVKENMRSIFGKKIKDDEYDIYRHIVSLHDLLERGKNGLRINTFRNVIYSQSEKSFLKNNMIDNKHMIEMMFELFYTRVGQEYLQIPYNMLSPMQLGSLYESFLEYSPLRAHTNMKFIKKVEKGIINWQWVESKESTNGATKSFEVKKGGVLFGANNTERKSTGSYYTPDYIVQQITSETLRYLCNDKKTDDILKFRICDPAMGSGHFLIGAVKYLAENISSKDDRFTLTESKKMVLENCIFGVDFNLSAVKLAKLSLWLETATPGGELVDLDKRILYGNSLVNDPQLENSFDWESIFSISNQKFDAILGNPPWGCDIKSFQAHLNEHYENETKNSAAYFLELALRLSENVGFVLPKSLCFYNSWSSARSLMSDRNLRLVEDYGVSFKGVNYEAVGLIVSNEEPGEWINVRRYSPIKHYAPSKDIGETGTYPSINAREYNVIPFIPLNLIEMNIINKVNNLSTRLVELREDIFRGLYIPDKIKKTLRSGSIQFVNKVPDVGRYEVIKTLDITLPSKFKAKAEKVMVPRLFIKVFRGNRLQCFPDTKGKFLTTEKLVNVTFNDSSKKHLQFIAGVLNSKLASFFIQKAFFSDSTETSRVMDEPYSGLLPIPRNIDASLKMEISNLVGKLLNAYKRKAYESANDLEGQVDRIIYSIYKLNKSEISIVEKYFDRKSRKTYIASDEYVA